LLWQWRSLLQQLPTMDRLDNDIDVVHLHLLKPCLMWEESWKCLWVISSASAVACFHCMKASVRSGISHSGSNTRILTTKLSHSAWICLQYNIAYCYLCQYSIPDFMENHYFYQAQLCLQLKGVRAQAIMGPIVNGFLPKLFH
jgi:hypothetical protein